MRKAASRRCVPHAAYGKRLLREFGRGFDASNLRHMRGFFLAFPIRDALPLAAQWRQGQRHSRGRSQSGSLASSITGSQDFYIDLVFYNYLLKCFVLIDLKTHKLTHQDIGQMDMYVRMYDDLKRGEGDNPTVGILLCEHKDESVVRYSVLNDSTPLFPSKYRLVLPSEDELRQEIARERAVLEVASHLQDEAES